MLGDRSPLFVDNPNPKGGRACYDADRVDLGWMKRCIERRWTEGTFEGGAEDFAEFVADQLPEAAHTKSRSVTVDDVWYGICEDGERRRWISYDLLLRIAFSGRGADTAHYHHEFSVALESVRVDISGATVDAVVDLPLPTWVRKRAGGPRVAGPTSRRSQETGDP